MRLDIKIIKSTIKNLNEKDNKLTRQQYIEILNHCKFLKSKYSRNRKPDNAKYLPIVDYKAKINKLKGNPNAKVKNQYIRNCAEIYHKLRISFIKKKSDYNQEKDDVASSTEISRLAAFLVGFNDPVLDDFCKDSTVG